MKIEAIPSQYPSSYSLKWAISNSCWYSQHMLLINIHVCIQNILIIKMLLADKILQTCEGT